MSWVYKENGKHLIITVILLCRDRVVHSRHLIQNIFTNWIDVTIAQLNIICSHKFSPTTAALIEVGERTSKPGLNSVLVLLRFLRHDIENALLLFRSHRMLCSCTYVDSFLSIFISLLDILGKFSAISLALSASNSWPAEFAPQLLLLIVNNIRNWKCDAFKPLQIFY